jgi:hypothetical protein
VLREIGATGNENPVDGLVEAVEDAERRMLGNASGSGFFGAISELGTEKNRAPWDGSVAIGTLGTAGSKAGSAAVVEAGGAVSAAIGASASRAVNVS